MIGDLFFIQHVKTATRKANILNVVRIAEPDMVEVVLLKVLAHVHCDIT